MKRNIESNLGYLMRILNISGKELAKAIHVDVSLVSKWKTKKRKIISESQYFNLLIDYIELKSTENKHYILNKALSKFDYKMDDEASRKAAIGDFILKENFEMLNNPLNIVLPSNPSESIYDYNYRIFKGNEGRRRAIIQFFDKIVSYDEPTTILVFTQEDMSWLTEDLAYAREWMMRFKEILNKGNKVKMIHFVDRNVSSIAEVIGYWLNLYTHPNIESYYYAKYSDVEFQITLFIEGSRLGIYGNQIIDEDPDFRYTAYYEDDYTIQMFKRLFDRYMQHSRPFVKNYLPTRYYDIVRHYPRDTGESKISFLSPLPHTSLFSGEHLIRLLKRHDVGKKQTAELIEYHDYFRSRMKNGYKGMLSYFELKRAYEQGSLFHDSLSRCLDKRIVLNREDLDELFDEIIELNQDENFEIVLLDDAINVFVNNMNVLVDHGRMIMSYSPENMTHVSVAEEATTVASFERYYSELWNQIPRVVKRAGVFEKRIQELRDSVG